MASFSFWYPFWHFAQPGVLWSWLASFAPMTVFSIIVLTVFLAKRREYAYGDALKHPAIIWASILLLIRSITLMGSGLHAVLNEWIGFLPIYLFLLIGIQLIKSPIDLHRYTWGAMLGGAFLTLFGVYAYHTGLRAQYGGLAGAYGNYENHNDYSFIVLQTIPFIFLARESTSNAFKRLILLCLLMASCYGIFLSQSRGGMLALVLQFVLIAGFTLPRKKKLIVLPLVVALGVGAIAVQFHRRAETNGDSYTEEEAKSSRYELWHAGLNMFMHHPLFGVGSGQYPEYSQRYGELSADQFGKNAHNTYIEVIAETGMAGAICFISMLIAIYKELKLPISGASGGNIEWIRRATMISFLTLLFRAILDAKDLDWSWFFFAVIAASLGAHRQYVRRIPKEAAPNRVEQGVSTYV